MISSMLCREEDFSSDWYRHWTKRIAKGAPLLAEEQQSVWGAVWAGMQGKWLHRKLWEWCAITQALKERGMLAPGRRGIGFAVGQEPLASLFAAHGAELTASDLQGDAANTMWAQTGQLGDSLFKVNWPGILPFEEFRKQVSYQNIDMRDLSQIPKESYDFSWSSCSFEHLGSLDAGLQFLIDSFDCLKPGGIAVHTTEFNVSSNKDTIDTGSNVIYRRKDIEAFELEIRKLGCAIENLDLRAGFEQNDVAFDYPPYYKHGRQHVKLKIGEYISTSLLLIIRKAT